MSIQEITLSNNQKKKLQKGITQESVLFQDDNGDLVVNVEAYQEFKRTVKKNERNLLIEAVVGDEVELDFSVEYFIFS